MLSDFSKLAVETEHHKGVKPVQLYNPNYEKFN